MNEKEPARHALVIGNADYKHLSEIPSARLDAERTTERLRELGFTVTQVADLTSLRAFEDEILPAFRKQVESGDLVLFYFSGHGFAYGPHNYLAPIDMPLSINARDVTEIAIAVESVESYFARRSPGLIVFLIDACRTTGGFIIADPANGHVMPKGLAEPRQSHHKVNTLVGFATRPGDVALGSAAAAQLSLFTSSLVTHIAREGYEFGTLFNDISSDVKVATNELQQPGLFDWSDSELYLRPSAAILAQQKEAWRATLASNRRELVLWYSYRFSISRHAAAARQWLDENPPTEQAPPFTLASPVAVERAWRPGDTRLAISPAVDGFAFERTLGIQASQSAQQLDNREIGLVPSGSKAAARTPAKTIQALQAIEAHGTAVTTQDFVALTEPSPTAQVASRLPSGTKLSIKGVQERAAQGTWLAASVPGRDQLVYLRVPSVNVVKAPIELGQALREVVAPPRATGIRDLVEPGEINAAIAALKAEGRTITWVSIATAPSGDLKESIGRAIRLAHAEYLLKRAGIEGRRITAVAKANDLSGNGVRVRFFGF